MHKGMPDLKRFPKFPWCTSCKKPATHVKAQRKAHARSLHNRFANNRVEALVGKQGVAARAMDPLKITIMDVVAGMVKFKAGFNRLSDCGPIGS